MLIVVAIAACFSEGCSRSGFRNIKSRRAEVVARQVLKLEGVRSSALAFLRVLSVLGGYRGWWK